MEIDAAAAAILDTAMRRLAAYPLADLKLGKVALNYAMASCSHRILAEHARAAIAVVQHSADQARWRIEQAQRIHIGDRVIGNLSESENGLTTTELSRRIRVPSDELKPVLESLLAAGRVVRTHIRTTGRTRTLWTLP